MKFYSAGIGILNHFFMTLTSWPSYMNLTHIPWRYIEYANMNILRHGFQKLSSDRQTDMTEIIPRCSVGGQKPPWVNSFSHF